MQRRVMSFLHTRVFAVILSERWCAGYQEGSRGHFSCGAEFLTERAEMLR